MRIVTGVQTETATDSPGETSEDHIYILETCIDDMNPELFGYLMIGFSQMEHWMFTGYRFI